MISTFGGRLAQARRELAVRLERDITRSDVAKAAGVDPSAVTLWERDKAIPREDALAKLAAFLNVTPAYLRYGIVPQFTEVVPGKELLSDFLDRENAKREAANESAAQAAGGRRRRRDGGKKAG